MYDSLNIKNLFKSYFFSLFSVVVYLATHYNISESTKVAGILTELRNLKVDLLL